MTDLHHPITPPPELVDQWYEASVLEGDITYDEYNFANLAARWGADQELEACCEWFVRDWTDIETADTLRAARRPKPPSLKEQALQAAQRFYSNGHEDCNDEEAKDDFDIIRRALESLPD
jgi:hypothetical protein